MTDETRRMMARLENPLVGGQNLRDTDLRASPEKPLPTASRYESNAKIWQRHFGRRAGILDSAAACPGCKTPKTCGCLGCKDRPRIKTRKPGGELSEQEG